MKVALLSSCAGLACLANAQYGSNTANNESSSDCPQPGGAHIIVARASLEAPGYGVIGNVKDAVIAAVPGSNAEPVAYPATLNDYLNSETQGVIAMRQLVNSYVARCPNFPLVLMGYSQGAQVSTDTAVGQQDAVFVDNSTNGLDQPLSTSILAQTAAIIVMGDPSFNTTETFHVGNATKHGLFPRQNVPDFGLTDLAGRTQSYCDAGDPYCASGNFSTLSVHLGYVNEYGTQATHFVVEQIKAWYAKNGNGTNVSSPSGRISKTASATGITHVTGTASRASITATASANSTKTRGSPTGTISSKTSVTTSSLPTFTGAASTIGGMAFAALSGSLFALLL